MAVWRIAAAFLLALALQAPAAADVVCRPNTLGTVSCPAPGPRPMPRPVGKSVQALDQVRERSEVPPGTEFIPARRTDRLGGITTTKGGANYCRPDTLGNLHCR
jgi:hypothetical protein